ncbi:uncharacterized protein GJ701_014737 [Geothlypis trichas]
MAGQPGKGARWVRGAGVPRGAQGCGVDQLRGAPCFNFLPSVEPISSGITCTVWGRGSLARLGSARPWSSPAAPATATREKNKEGEDREPPRAPSTSEDGADQAPTHQEDGSCSPHSCQDQTSPRAGHQAQ